LTGNRRKLKPRHFINMRAYLDSPIREAVQVYVNDQFAGYLWHPITGWTSCHSSSPTRMNFALSSLNTAINQLAGMSQPNYRLLHARYGMLFQPQSKHEFQPPPSSILGKVTLIESASSR
jgi:hypothetical protein